MAWKTVVGSIPTRPLTKPAAHIRHSQTSFLKAEEISEASLAGLKRSFQAQPRPACWHRAQSRPPCRGRTTRSQAGRCPRETRPDSGAMYVERQVRTWIGLNATIVCVAGMIVHRSLRLDPRKTEVAGLSAKTGTHRSARIKTLVQIWSRFFLAQQIAGSIGS
jgi:hypothetical protein